MPDLTMWNSLEIVKLFVQLAGWGFTLYGLRLALRQFGLATRQLEVANKQFELAAASYRDLHEWNRRKAAQDAVEKYKDVQDDNLTSTLRSWNLQMP